LSTDLNKLVLKHSALIPLTHRATSYIQDTHVLNIHVKLMAISIDSEKRKFIMRRYLKTSSFRYSPLVFLLAALLMLITGMQQARGASPEGEPDKAKYAVLAGYWESEKQGECVVYRAEGSNFFIMNSTYDGLYGTLSGEVDSMTFRFAKEYADSLADPRATAEVQKKFMDYVIGLSERIVFTQTDVNGTKKDVLNIYGQTGSVVDHVFRLDEATARARIEKLRTSSQKNSAQPASPGK
jgi:hypothetical protein